MILVGDALERLKELPDGSVHCCVTSPPYFGLRDYGTGEWKGGDVDCDHKLTTGTQGATGQRADRAHTQEVLQRDVCRRCGAVRVDQQIGLETTPDQYVERMVALFREVRRVLRDDGTLWLNIGDSYAANRSYQVSDGKHQSHDYGDSNATRVPVGMKQKDLMGIPWMLAFALRADGWYLRQEIIWAKPNPMPESVRDRCTKAHEQIFLLTKKPRYFFDAEAIKEEAVTPAGTKGAKGSAKRSSEPGVNSRPPEYAVYNGFRNKRDVWTVTTKPFKEAHFATFPPDLIEPCILAGTSAHGVCADCGAPWKRDVKRTKMVIDRSERTHEKGRTRSSGTMVEPPTTTTTTGWSSTCECNAAVAPATVLDPFFGAGTTGLVARQHGRNYIGCELNPEYVEIAERRIAAAFPPATSVDPLLWLLLAA